MTLGLGFGLSVFGLHALDAAHRQSWNARIRGTQIGLSLAALAASALGMAILAGRMFGTPLRELEPSHLQTLMELPGFALALGLRIAALGGFLMMAVAGIGRPVIQSLLLAVALATLAWFGHGAASDGELGLLHLASSIVHLLAAGLWLGAIAAFLLIASASPNSESGFLSQALRRFHLTGSLIVGLLLATGLLNAAMMLGSGGLATAWGTAWGQLMVLKLLAFAAMLGLAALNRFRLAPLLAGNGAQGPLVFSLRAELLLATSILFLVGWLGLLSPSGD